VILGDVHGEDSSEVNFSGEIPGELYLGDILDCFQFWTDGLNYLLHGLAPTISITSSRRRCRLLGDVPEDVPEDVPGDVLRLP
jgi:hypothetical protein